jgi:uncharacterized protein (TIGR02147 family)
MNQRPNVYEYTDYRAFLKAMIAFETERGVFSYSKFALRAGFQSRSYLRTVITGKRNLSPDAICKVIVGFGMAYAEGESFKSLVHYNQASDFNSRRHYWEAFLKSKPKSQKSLKVSDVYSYLARMAYPILLILLRQSHVDHSVENLSNLTGLNATEINEALNTLTKLGAITPLLNGEYQVNADGFITSNDIPNIAIQAFHINMLERAKSCLSLHTSQREFQSMLVPLSEEEFQFIRSRIRSLVDEVDQKFGGKRPDSTKVYALNLNLIPLTPEFIRAKTSSASQKPDAVMEQEHVS